MTTALIIIDMQADMQARLDAGRDCVNGDADAKITRLAAGFRAAGLPVIHVRHADADPSSPFHPDQPGHQPMACDVARHGGQGRRPRLRPAGPVRHRYLQGVDAPNVRVSASGGVVEVRFILNPFACHAELEEAAILTFTGCRMWRFGATNDEGWFRGQCRYSGHAPRWGEFYELSGEDALEPVPSDWAPASGHGIRHFLFYFRDNTFECFAEDWALMRYPPTGLSA